jgi:hypothetical protein
MEDSILPVPISPITPTGACPTAHGPAAPLLSLDKRPLRDSDKRFSVAAMREAFELPQIHWAGIAAIPEVAAALAAFPSEQDTRPKNRLDLVSWVATISGFGCDGPSDEDWHALFSACCFAPLRMSELHIATLIAFRKCCEDLPLDVSIRNTVKMRIRPAVEGRIQARAPGILLQVQRKYDEYLYAVWPKCLIQQAVRDTDPATLLLSAAGATGFGSDELQSADDSSSASTRVFGGPLSSEKVRILCERQVEAKMKLWEEVMVQVLRLDLTGEPTGPRLCAYLKQRDLYRTQLREAISNAVCLYLLDRQTGWIS